MSPVPSHAADCRRGVPRGARFLDSRIGDSGFSQSKKPTRKTSAPRHADLRRGRLRRNGMAAPCGRPRASATRACVDFPATVPQAAWRRALDDPFACMPPWRLGRTSPRHPLPSRRCGVHAKTPAGHAERSARCVTFVEVPEASGPPVAPPACVRGSTAGEAFSPSMQGGPPPDGQGRGAPKKRKSRPDACRRGRLNDRLEVEQ